MNRKIPDKQDDGRIPGIDCEACHNITGRTGIDNGAFELSFKADGEPVKYGPRTDAVSPYHETAFSKMHTRPDFCGTCHNVTHPLNNVPIERTFDEWLESTYAKEGIDCQDCHMKTYEGKAAVMGPDRADVASHDFSGANSTVLKHMGSDEAAEKARQMLQTAASIKFEDIPEKFRPGMLSQVVVKVENIGAGHKLPMGFSEGREIWIDFSVTDASGSEVYGLGKIIDGKTEPNTRNFKVHLGACPRMHFSPTLRFFHKNNARNIAYMAVLIFLKNLDLKINAYSRT
ncbi:MAG: hypothetical protein GY799_34260, partial [Desulfobulbaceae bacterium]|nr:hypothetical protein [Desulfobulbaceae bacterium]